MLILFSESMTETQLIRLLIIELTAIIILGNLLAFFVYKYIHSRKLPPPQQLTISAEYS